MTTRPFPWDSPAVSHLSTDSHYRRPRNPHLLQEPGRRFPLRLGDVAVGQPALAHRGKLAQEVGPVEVAEEPPQERRASHFGECPFDAAGRGGHRRRAPREPDTPRPARAASRPLRRPRPGPRPRRLTAGTAAGPGPARTGTRPRCALWPATGPHRARPRPATYRHLAGANARRSRASRRPSSPRR